MVPVAFLVTVIVFGLLRLAPGDPVTTFAGEERDPETLNQIRRSLGLDQPLPVQYVFWIGRAVQGDFGRSIRTRQPVAEAIVERLGATLELGLAAVLLSSTISLVVGTISALRRNSFTNATTTNAQHNISSAIRLKPSGRRTKLFSSATHKLWKCGFE